MTKSNDNNLASEEDVVVIDREDEVEPETKNGSASAATKPKRRASTQKDTPATPRHKSKRARRAMKQ